MGRRIVILGTGSLGDVGPLIGLGRKLLRRGYRVAIAVPENYMPLVIEHGLEARRCGGDSRKFAASKEFFEFVTSSPVRQWWSITRMPQWMSKAYEETLTDAVLASQDADAILFTPWIIIGTDIADSKSIPSALIACAPATPTSKTPIPILPYQLGPLFNRLSYLLLHTLRLPMLPAISRIRGQYLRLASSPPLKNVFGVGGKNIPVLYLFSNRLLPAGSYAGSPNAFVTGYCFCDKHDDMPENGLLEFLAEGNQPLYVGFGSMPAFTDVHVTMLLEACLELNLRAVISRGWSPFDDSNSLLRNKSFYIVDAAPHRHVFDRVKAVIHHGGLGTTMSGLRARRPTLVCPFLFDQYFYGQQIARLKVGPKPFPLRRWTPKRLVETLTDLVNNPVYAQQAKVLGDLIRNEDGCNKSALVIEQIIGPS